MGRPRKVQSEAVTITPMDDKVKDDPMLPKKSLFNVDEVANYFGVTERCVRLWIDHGHLDSEKIVGSVRVSRASILRCRFRGRNSEIVM